MREIQVRVFDDLDYSREGLKNEASATITVGLNGTWRELDVTEANEKMIRDLLHPVLSAGHEPDSPVPVQARQVHDSQRMAFLKNLREWVRAQGLRNPENTGWAYQTGASLSYYYSRDLLDKYQAYLAAGHDKGGKDK